MLHLTDGSPPLRAIAAADSRDRRVSICHPRRNRGPGCSAPRTAGTRPRFQGEHAPASASSDRSHNWTRPVLRSRAMNATCLPSGETTAPDAIRCPGGASCTNRMLSLGDRTAGAVCIPRAVHAMPAASGIRIAAAIHQRREVCAVGAWLSDARARPTLSWPPRDRRVSRPRVHESRLRR